MEEVEIKVCKGQAYLIIEALGKLLNYCAEVDEPVILEILGKVIDASKTEETANLQEAA
jgi:hypothetical protein